MFPIPPPITSTRKKLPQKWWFQNEIYIVDLALTFTVLAQEREQNKRKPRLTHYFITPLFNANKVNQIMLEKAGTGAMASS